MGNRFAHIADRIANNEASSKIEIDGKDVSFRYSDIILSNEEDHGKRRLIEDKRLKAVSYTHLNNTVYHCRRGFIRLAWCVYRCSGCGYSAGNTKILSGRKNKSCLKNTES